MLRKVSCEGRVGRPDKLLSPQFNILRVEGRLDGRLLRLLLEIDKSHK